MHEFVALNHPKETSFRKSNLTFEADFHSKPNNNG